MNSQKKELVEEFRNKLLERYNNKCILTGSKICQACHIIHHAESNNMFIDNGLLLSYQHHILFDNYVISINPRTLRVEVNDNANSDDQFINMIDGKRIYILKQFPITIKYLEKHYKIFIES